MNNQEPVGGVVDAIAALVARFAAAGKLPVDTPGLRESIGVQVLYQKTPDEGGSIHMVRFRFVTPDDIEMHVDIDFNLMSMAYINNMVDELRKQLREFREDRQMGGEQIRIDTPPSPTIALSTSISDALRTQETIH